MPSYEISNIQCALFNDFEYAGKPFSVNSLTQYKNKFLIWVNNFYD